MTDQGQANDDFIPKPRPPGWGSGPKVGAWVSGFLAFAIIWNNGQHPERASIVTDVVLVLALIALVACVMAGLANKDGL